MSKKLDPKMAEKVMLKAGLKPLESYINSKNPWKCRCLLCRKIIFPTYSNIKNGSGCAYCSGVLIDPIDAVKRMKKSKLHPLEPFIDSRSPWKSKCMKCGSLVKPILHDIRRGNGGCKTCGIKKQASETRVPKQVANLIMVKAKLKPLEPYVGSNKPWKSECMTCRRIVSPTLSSIKAGGSCRFCMFNKTGKKQRLPKDDAVNRMFKAHLQPLVPYAGSNKPWKSLCLKCGEIVSPHLNSVTKGGGCFYCAVAGIQMNKPSYVYLITNQRLNAHKIGIGNQRKSRDRLNKFLRKGWRSQKVWAIKTGAEALRIEKAVFKVIRKDLKLPVYLSREQMPVTGGETETINADSITLLELEKIIKKVIKGYKP
jgi:hypothetical protein